MANLRVTQQELYKPLLEGVQKSTSKIQDLRMAISTGKRVRSPSDDPLAIRRILDFKDKLKEIDQFNSNLVDARATITQELDMVENLQSRITDVRTFLIESGRAGYGADERKTIGAKVDQILGGVFQGANTKFLGRFIFAGGETQTQPFQETVDGTGKITSVAYNGDSKEIKYQISDGIDLTINKPGSDLYMNNKVFSTLIRIRDAFDSNDTAVLDAELAGMDKLENGLFRTIGDLGTRLSQVTLIEDRNVDTKIRLEQLRSTDEDADITEMITQLQVQENVLQAALAAGARVTNLSLLNFL